MRLTIEQVNAGLTGVDPGRTRVEQADGWVRVEVHGEDAGNTVYLEVRGREAGELVGELGRLLPLRLSRALKDPGEPVVAKPVRRKKEGVTRDA